MSKKKTTTKAKEKSALAAQMETQAALDRHEAAGTVTDPEYVAATQEFYARHVCRTTPVLTLDELAV